MLRGAGLAPTAVADPDVGPDWEGGREGGKVSR
jgi:hypothetical protein